MKFWNKTANVSGGGGGGNGGGNGAGRGGGRGGGSSDCLLLFVVVCINILILLIFSSSNIAPVRFW